jgi:predicted glycoside hydrolase/deacetylase ChbG (UPF0249 family)
VAADDFGLDPQVNAGALRLAQMGRVSAIGCMVGAPFWREGIEALQALDGRKVEVGLHLDLTEHPLDESVRRPLWQWIAQAWAGARPHALQAEIEAQLDAFERALGRPPDFVDGHEHVHQFPGVRQALVRSLVARGWTPWLRTTRRAPGVREPKAWVVESLGARGLERLARAHGLRHNRGVVGVYDFDPAGFQGRLQHWLSLARSGDVLVCHPAAQLPRCAPMPQARVNEFELLSGGAFGAWLEAGDLHIVPLGARMRRRRARNATQA